jgi:hypothetical protein
MLNCTVANKLDDFIALPGLASKYQDMMEKPDELIGT